MKPKFVKPSDMAWAISDAVAGVARDIELKETPEERTRNRTTRLERLCETFELHEALSLFKLMEPRIKCIRCGKIVAYTRASGPRCWPCGAAVRAEAEAGA